MENKAILMSIQPQWVCKILNGEKTIEVRKKFPKDFKGWVYIYCTKDQGYNGETQIVRNIKTKKYSLWADLESYNANDIRSGYNGLVLARFWCNKVEEIRCSWGSNFIDWSKYPSDERYDYYIGNEMDTCDICRVACLKMEELDNYLKGKKGYAIHITKLEAFDKPNELKELKKVGYNKLYNQFMDNCLTDRNSYENLEDSYSLTKAPQNFCYVEDIL